MSQPGHPPIPDRTSSKRAFEQSIESDSQQKQIIDKEIQSRRKKIKARGSFDAKYWAEHKEVNELELQRHELVRKISFHQFLKSGGQEADWDTEDKAMTLREEENSLVIKDRVLREHVERMTFPHNDTDRVHRKWLMEMLTSIPAHKGGIGMGDIVGQGPRDNTVQSSFRSKLQIAYNSRHPAEEVEEHWCPIIGSWVHEDLIRAAHIFPYSAGQTAMDELFGRDANDREELFEPENGIMMSVDAEKRIANGCIVLVPDVPNDATAMVYDEWTRAKIKSYKLRVLQPTDKSMKAALPGMNEEHGKDRRYWHELDGQQVKFRSDFRPRVRYLYWQFAVSLLRKAWQTQHRENNPLTEEFGKQFWGTRGRWIKKKHLLGFAEYLGHAVEWENLMEAAMEPDNEEDKRPDAGGVIVACNQLREVRRNTAKGWEHEEEEEGEDDYDDEDEYGE